MFIKQDGNLDFSAVAQVVEHRKRSGGYHYRIDHTQERMQVGIRVQEFKNEVVAGSHASSKVEVPVTSAS